jgi:hypothetical protein
MRRFGLLLLAVAGCEVIGGIKTITLAPSDEGPGQILDGGFIVLPDGAIVPADGGVPPPGDGGASGPYNSLVDPANWATFDLGVLIAGLHGFKGGAFDGRYVYFVPNRDPLVSGGQNGLAQPARSVVVQFDTNGSFADKASWHTFDVAGVNAQLKGFRGAVFDGRYVYLVPNWNGNNPLGVIVRYDTKAPFDVAGSWTPFDVGTAFPAAKGFHSGVFDGRYVYLVPFQNNANTQDGVAVRYDTQAPFTTAASWGTFDLVGNNVAATAKGFAGGVFDGQYVYFVPRNASNGQPVSGTGTAVRYDTKQAFGTAASWGTFDTTKVNANSRGFLGGVFDGRYVYFMPHFLTAPNGFTGTFVRYDTHAPFGDVTSWTPFDTATVSPTARAFGGGAFDGRYVYFVPLFDGSPNGTVTRYDTSAPFTTLSSWSTFDTGSLSGSPRWFGGGVFDGQYLYFVPFGTSIAVRFTARTSRAMPQLPAFNGSFL